MTAKENADYLIARALRAGIADHRELAIFRGQMEVECGGFVRMHENLNYSPGRLLQVFRGRNGLDTPAEAAAIVAGGPEAIADAFYGRAWGKLNLGNTEDGDGWKYRGRGYVQLTGRMNYERVGRELGLDLAGNPELAADRDVAARIAIHYWTTRVRPHGHQLDIRAATRDINGGYNHLPERRRAAEAWLEKFEQGYIERNGLAEHHDNRVDAQGDVRHTMPSLDDAAHPRHALYTQTLRRLRDAEAVRGLASGEHSRRLASALTVAAIEHGLTQVDRVELNTTGTLARAVQISPVRDELGLNRSTPAIDIAQALTHPPAESGDWTHRLEGDHGEARELDLRAEAIGRVAR